MRAPSVPIAFPRAGEQPARLFGMLHLPRAPLRDLGVVLCNPLGYEALSVHRAYRHLAERLAAAGIAALRFDHEGTGDSAGPSLGAGRVRAWIDGIGCAIQELRACAPQVRRIALFGVRFGGTLAAAAARELGGIEALVLWAPVPGRMHARELRTFAMVKATAGVAPRPGDRVIEVGGFDFARETLDEMAAMTPGEPDGPRALVLPPTEPGYAAMMRDDPYDSIVPSATLDAIVDWLRDAGDRVASPPPAARRSDPVIEVSTRDGLATLRETSLRFGEADRLFGIVTEPPRGWPRDRPAVCLLNVGADHHVGPHRMNVDLARELASRGYLTMRFDAAGLGDSLASPGAAENRIYTKDGIDDVRRAMDLLAETHGARRFVLVGTCSGAYLAFHTTLVDPRVAGQLLVSPFAFEWKDGDPVTPTGRSAEPLPSRGRGNAVERAFVATCERGVASLIVAASNDGGVDMIAAHLGPDACWMRERPGFALAIVEEADHTFTSRAAQRTLRFVVERYMHAQFA